MKSFKSTAWILPQPVLIIGTYDKNGKPNAMNAAWGELIVIDSTIAYIGSANLTGAGMGMKSPRKRNFEVGILTDDPEMVEAAIEQFDNVWIGKFCKECGRREYCSDPIK